MFIQALDAHDFVMLDYDGSCDDDFGRYWTICKLAVGDRTPEQVHRKR